jgi:excisionase family DNA binding protein
MLTSGIMTPAQRDDLQVEAIRRWLARTPAERCVAKEQFRWRLTPPEYDLPAQEWMSIAEATTFMRVSRKTVYTWAEKGLVQSCRTPGGRVRIARASLIKPRQVA